MEAIRQSAMDMQNLQQVKDFASSFGFSCEIVAPGVLQVVSEELVQAESTKHQIGSEVASDALHGESESLCQFRAFGADFLAKQTRK